MTIHHFPHVLFIIGFFIYRAHVLCMYSVGYGDICPSDKMTHIGKLFIVALSFCGLGMFCGPVMDFSASWKERIPGGVVGPGLFALVFGTSLFMQIEDMEWHSAVYFAIITGTTVGYGDLGPKTDYGRFTTALLWVSYILLCTDNFSEGAIVSDKLIILIFYMQCNIGCKCDWWNAWTSEKILIWTLYGVTDDSNQIERIWFRRNETGRE